MIYGIIWHMKNDVIQHNVKWIIIQSWLFYLLKLHIWSVLFCLYPSDLPMISMFNILMNKIKNMIVHFDSLCYTVATINRLYTIKRLPVLPVHLPIHQYCHLSPNVLFSSVIHKLMTSFKKLKCGIAHPPPTIQSSLNYSPYLLVWHPIQQLTHKVIQGAESLGCRLHASDGKGTVKNGAGLMKPAWWKT